MKLQRLCSLHRLWPLSLSTVRQGEQHTPLWSPLSLFIPLKTCSLFCVRPLYKFTVPKQHSLLCILCSFSCFACSTVIINCWKDTLFFLPASDPNKLAKRLWLKLPRVWKGKNKVGTLNKHGCQRWHHKGLFLAQSLKRAAATHYKRWLTWWEMPKLFKITRTNRKNLIPHVAAAKSQRHGRIPRCPSLFRIPLSHREIKY